MALRDHEEGGAEGYFASVSDLMVGILFVFLLMLTVFALNYRVAEHDLEVGRARFDSEKARADRVRDLLEQAAVQLQQDIEASTNARDRLLTTLQTILSQRGIEVWVDRQAGILHLPGDLLFETLSATLGPRQRDSVGILATALARILPCFTPITDRTRCAPPICRFWKRF
jgi:chemotaxis protein MotB